MPPVDDRTIGARELSGFEPAGEEKPARTVGGNDAAMAMRIMEKLAAAATVATALAVLPRAVRSIARRDRAGR